MNPNSVVFENLNNCENLIHAFSTRNGGRSNGIFSSLNLGLSTPDKKEIVYQNRDIFFNKLEVSKLNLAIPKQIHSGNVRIVTQPGIYDACDALITREENLFLTVQTADCYPIFLFDPHLKVCALVHSGWRGTAERISIKTIKKMITHFKCQPENILAAIGPGVQKKCYQVDLKTASNFSKFYLKEDGFRHYLLDIQGLIINQLKEAGIKEHIEVDGRCTHCEKDTFYSYRRDGTQSGRMMGILGLKTLF